MTLVEALLQEAAAEEVASKTAKHISMRTSLARFPFVKNPWRLSISATNPRWTRS